MPAQRSEWNVLQDRARMAELVLEGRNNVEIAAELGLSPQTVGRDLKAMEDEWRATMLSSIAEHKARELARLNQIERDLWDAWEASKADSRRNIQWIEPGTPTADNQNPAPIPVRASLITENQQGDPRFIKLILDVCSRRIKLLGLDGPVDVSAISAQGEAYEELSYEERKARAIEILRGVIEGDTEVASEADGYQDLQNAS